MGFGHCGAFICLYTLFPFSLLSLLSVLSSVYQKCPSSIFPSSLHLPSLPPSFFWPSPLFLPQYFQFGWSLFLPLFLSSASHWRRMLQVSGSRFRVWRSWVAVTIRMPVMSWTGWSRRVRAVQNRSTPMGCPADAPSKQWVCCFLLEGTVIPKLWNFLFIRVSMLLNSWIFPVKMKPDWCILMFDLFSCTWIIEQAVVLSFTCVVLWVDQVFILNAVPDEASVNRPEISAAFGLTCQDCDKTHKGSIICRQVTKW